jgi:5'-3' exonuclease
MWVIIDGNNWYGRAFFALKPTMSQEPEIIRMDLELRCGRAVQTVLNWIEDTKLQLKPTMLAICWDSTSSFRKELCPEYKAGRGEKPAGYCAAMGVLRMCLEGYRQCESSGFEADDLLAGFARDAIDEGERCLLCSSDEDLHQCLTTGVVSQCTRVKRLADHRLEFNVLTADGLFKLYGVKPWQWIDYRCIVGDRSDGLPGAPGVGPKAALAILGACGTLDRFYEEPDKAPLTALKLNTMLEFKSQLPLMRDLVTLRPNALSKLVPA